MIPPNSLHTLILSSTAKHANWITGVLQDLFPNSRFLICKKTEEAMKSLDKSPFDLGVLVFDRVQTKQARLIEKMRSLATPMPVLVLIKSADEQKFHELLPAIDADWGLAHLDTCSDIGLSRAVEGAIRRYELKWERNHLQRAFQSSLLQYRNLFDEVPDVIFLCDRSGCLLDVNATASRVFHMPKDKMILKPIAETFGLDPEIFTRLVQGATESKGPIEDIEVEFHPPNGEVIHGLAHMICLHQQTPGRPIQFQGVIKDITQRKALELQLRRSEVKHKTLYELAQISSSSLQLEEVARRSLRLISARCGTLGSALLLNRRSDELNVIAAENMEVDAVISRETGRPIQLGHGTVGRWAISGRIQTADRQEFQNLEGGLAAWLERLGADRLYACPLGHSNTTLPATILLLAVDKKSSSLLDDELLLGLAKTLEIGVNNCHHYASAREAESKYREIWDTAPAFFLSLLKGGVIFEINMTAAQALGYKLQEMIGKPFTDFLDPRDRPVYDRHHLAIIGEKKEQNYELRLVKRDGEIIVASMNSEPLLNADGAVIGEKAVLYDITRDKQLEASLRDHSENLERKVRERTTELTQTMNFLNGVLEGSTEYAIFGLDLEGKFVHFNRGAQLILHHDPEEVVNRKSLDSFTKSENKEPIDLKDLLNSADRHGVLVREFHMRRGDGRMIVAQMTLNRLRSSAPGNLAYVGIARDITEQKELERKLKLYTESLQQEIDKKIKELDQKHIELIQSSKLATLGEMATGIAHELNQPLSGIRTRAQLLAKMIERGKTDPAKNLATQKEIVELVDRISRIIDHMRVFSRQDEQPFAPFDLRQSVEGCLNLLGEQLRLHAIEVAIDAREGLPRAYGEPSQIEQVLLNLISNARDAMDEKADMLRLTPEGTGGYCKRLDVTLNRSGDAELCIAVTDNGGGISEETRERVFEPFYTTKPVGRGTGLGLSISYGIITKHQGRIEVQSKVGQGTTFRIYLPICEEDQSSNGMADTPTAVVQHA